MLASNTREIDLIIGGHTHTFLNKPVYIKNLDKHDVQIAQVGYGGINIGRIDYLFTQKLSLKKINSSSICVK